MKRFMIWGGVALLASLSFATFTPAQDPDVPKGHIVIPPSSVQRPQDLGVRAHTNFYLFVPDGYPDPSIPPPTANTPASIACVYQLVTPQVMGCPIIGTTLNPTGGANAVAIVDAYDNPDAETDLGTYSTQFGLPSCTKGNGCFSQVYANGHQPANDPGGWSLEEALDIEMAHAMAPGAKIILVEGASNSFADLYLAEDVAGTMVAAAGGGEVTNSWSGGEYSGELSDDSHFRVSGAVYLASSGDGGPGVGYPCASHDVLCAGGTSVNRVGGKFTTETSWSGSGGGISAYEVRPKYQKVIKSIVGSKRGVPDLSLLADPNTGVACYDLDGNYQWFQVGGTSVSSPALAGILNSAGRFDANTPVELALLYREYGNATKYAADFRDITSGPRAMVGWDEVTGIGVPITYTGK
jgi:subtilase family serine protease